VTLKPPQILAPRSAFRPLGLVNTLDAEIAEERASTLGRLTKAFEAALDAWRAAEAEEGGGEAAARRRERLFEAAAEALWMFVVQRESCGLRNTEAVLREYGVPRAMQLRMGPRSASKRRS
jgi:hypothetical protein